MGVVTPGASVVIASLGVMVHGVGMNAGTVVAIS